jgi:hypothetical protein
LFVSRGGETSWGVADDRLQVVAALVRDTA